MRKRAFSLLLAAILLLLPLCAQASGQTVTAEELGMTITFPEEFMLFSREIDPADENLFVLGTTAEALEAQFRESGVYLNAIHMNPLYEYVVTMTTDSGMQALGDFSDFSDKELEQMADEMLIALEETGVTYSGYEIAHIGSYTYFILDPSQIMGGQQVYGHQYYTIFNGMAVNITLQSYTGKVTPEMKAEHRAIMETVSFPEKTISAQKSSLFDTGLLRNSAIGAAIGLAVGTVLYVTARLKKKKRETRAYASTSISEKRLMSVRQPASCKDCGAKLSPGQEFCGGCGARTALLEKPE